MAQNYEIKRARPSRPTMGHWAFLSTLSINSVLSKYRVGPQASDGSLSDGSLSDGFLSNVSLGDESLGDGSLGDGSKN